MLKSRPDGYGMYNGAKDRLKVIRPFFENYFLDKITKVKVADFYHHLMTRTYTKTVVTVKQSLKEYL